MEFRLIFGEINFVEVPKICEIHEIYRIQKGTLWYHDNMMLHNYV